jgi:dTDP-4-dehydrorhamnose 3,5-epimerase
VNVVAGPLAGVSVVELAPVADERGWFVRAFDAEVFAAAGLATHYAQHGRAHNALRGTVRGLHWQAEPHGEIKVIRCVAGAAYDVLVDVRPASPGYGAWHGFDLRADVPVALYVPPGFAHGYQTLADGTEFEYLISVPYVPDAARGIAYDSPALAIPWPLPVARISARDRALPAFAPTDRR